ESLKVLLDSYKPHFTGLRCGEPLLGGDVSEVAELLSGVVKSRTESSDAAHVFIGHGTAHSANSAYGSLQARLGTIAHIGTVEAEPSQAEVLARVKASGAKRVALYPLMIVAGEHALTDIAGDSPDSWKSMFEREGFTVECVLTGLGEYPEVRAMFVNRAAKQTHGVLYGVGVGPGDPEHLTLKAVRVLNSVDVIAAPEQGGDHIALDIVTNYLDGKRIIRCATPMSNDPEVTGKAYRAAAVAIAELLDAGRSVAFVTLGDPSIYSTYLYIQRLVRELGYACEIVPGITSFCAAAARLGSVNPEFDGLCSGTQPLLIVPASASDDLIDLPVNKVLMKRVSSLPALAERFKSRGARIAAVTNCGLPGEQLAFGVDALHSVKGYLTLVVVKESTP
ncbi:MAG: precorrin-2 C(20)-methyltransferase, partial [Oscillospiraceae bacterium]|nr:precorrin-2 C(20)-methyltransferase [Oscillospiraceae bacterium]